MPVLGHATWHLYKRANPPSACQGNRQHPSRRMRGDRNIVRRQSSRCSRVQRAGSAELQVRHHGPLHVEQLQHARRLVERLPRRSLVKMNNQAVTTVTSAAVQSTVVPRISKAALAMINPAVTGCSPACSALRQLASLKRYHAPLTRKVRMEDGAATARS